MGNQDEQRFLSLFSCPLQKQFQYLANHTANDFSVAISLPTRLVHKSLRPEYLRVKTINEKAPIVVLNYYYLPLNLVILFNLLF